MNAYVGVEGFLTKSGFILKEPCIFYDGEGFDHYIFKERTWELSNRYLEMIHHISSQLNGLQFLMEVYPTKTLMEYWNVSAVIRFTPSAI